MEEPKFRLQNKRIFMKYNDHLDKEEFPKWFSDKVKGNIKFLRIAHETGETGYKHSHVLVEFKKAFQTTNQRFFDLENNHPNIKKVLDENHWNNCIEYLWKEDKDNIDLMPKGNIADIIWEKDNLQDALRMCKKVSDATGIKTIFNAKKKVLPPLQGRLKPWQQEALDYCFGQVNDRTIRVYYDREGNKGKTWFVKYMISNYPEKCLFFTAINYRDTAFALKKAVDNGWEGDTILINLSRDYQERDSIYGIMESMKDGLITSNKYESDSFRIQDVHVILMVNFEVNLGACSKDRWDIITM